MHRDAATHSLHSSFVMENTLTWNATEHKHIERGGDWYWALGITVVSFALIAILFNDVLFAILILLAGLVLGMLASRPHPSVPISLEERGLMVDGTLYPYEEMFAFWVTQGDDPILFIDTPRFMTPDLMIPLHGIDPESVRSFLTERVLETEMRESSFYKTMELFGF